MGLSDHEPNSREIADFDKAVCLTGYGKFHFELIAVCALSVITVGFQNGLSSYVFPAAQCELNLTSFELGLLNIMFLSGGIISCFLWGILADLNGRKRILIVTHLLNAFVTVLCAFFTYKSALVICRFFNGFLIGAPGTIVFSYLAEFQPPKYRSTSVCYCGLFFTASWLLLPIFAHLILPLDLHCQLGLFSVTPWRLYLVVMVVPEAVVGLWFTRMPESPKFFLAKGNTREAVLVLRRMYSRNTGKSASSFPVKYLASVSTPVEGRNILNSVEGTKKTLQIFLVALKQTKVLLRPPLAKATVLTCTIMFSNMFGVYGLGLWIPELFLRFKQYQNLHPNDTITPSFDWDVIRTTIAIAASSLLYNIISGLLSTRIPIKIILMVSMLLGGISAGSIYFLESSLQNLVVACVFQASMVTANMVIGSIAVELFSTEVTAVALSLIMCAGRLGAVCSNAMFGYLMDRHGEIPIFVVAAVVLMGAGLCFVITNKSRPQLGGLQECGDRKKIEVSVIS